MSISAPWGDSQARREPMPPSTPRPRVAILDDHEVLLDAMGTWIQHNAQELDLVLSAKSWLELVHSSQFPTDLVILDFQLKESVSIEARVRTCRAAGAKVLVLSSLDTDDARRRALDTGAVAFLPKSAPMREIIEAAHKALSIDSSQIPARVARPQAIATSVNRAKLSAGEAEALALYASGLSLNDVADRMGVQYETAKTYLRRVREKYAKLERPASRKADLIRRAAEDGYLV